jgi:hypothetical protein
MSRLLLAPLALSGAATIVLLAGCGGGSSSSNNPAPAVTQKVTGFVTDADTAAPIVGATVKVQGTTITSSTAADGSYTVGPLNPTRSYNLLITFPGYVDDSVKMLSKSATLQGPGVILTKANTPNQITNSAGGTSTSNATLEGNTATVTIPASAMPGGTDGSVSTTLLVGTAVPGAATDTTKIIYPVVNVSTSAGGSFTQAVTVTLPLTFAYAAGATLPVYKLGSDGNWAATSPAITATAAADGKSASFTTTIPGTYGFQQSIQATANVTGTDRQPVAGPYTDPVVVPLTGVTVNWSAQGADGRDFLDASFTEKQRQLVINVPGDLDATQLVIHPRGTAQINVVKNQLTVNFTANGFTIQQAASSTGSGTIDGLAWYEIVPHQQGSSSGG